MKRSIGARIGELVEWMAVHWPGQSQLWNPSEWNQEPEGETDPPTGADLQATWKPEDQGDDGEDIGPLIVWDPLKHVVWESDDWMRLSQARELAESKGLKLADLS